MRYVDEINVLYGGEGTKLYSTAASQFKKLCIQHKLKLLDASVRHLGTDINYVVLENLYNDLKSKVDFYFDTPVQALEAKDGGFTVVCADAQYRGGNVSSPLSRSGSKWMEGVCRALDIPTKSNRGGPRRSVRLPACRVFSPPMSCCESEDRHRTGEV